jgi:hypothetical protein
MPLKTQVNSSVIAPKPKPGGLYALRKKLWWAILRAEHIIDDPETLQDLRLRAINAMGQVGTVYMRLLEGSELEQRLAALEAEVARPAPRRIG